MLNKVILMGRLTKDPEMRYTSTNSVPVCTFTLAVDRRFSKQGEDKKADFIQCQAWNKTAEFISKYFGKGKMIAVAGRIQTRSWDDAEGKKRYVTEIIVEEVHFAGDKGGSKENDNKGDAYEGGYGGGQQRENNYYPLESEDDLPF